MMKRLTKACHVGMSTLNAHLFEQNKMISIRPPVTYFFFQFSISKIISWNLQSHNSLNKTQWPTIKKNLLIILFYFVNSISKIIFCLIFKDCLYYVFSANYIPYHFPKEFYFSISQEAFFLATNLKRIGFLRNCTNSVTKIPRIFTN